VKEAGIEPAAKENLTAENKPLDENSDMLIPETQDDFALTGESEADRKSREAAELYLEIIEADN